MYREDLEDVLYEKSDHVAHIWINRPEIYNALRKETFEGLIHCFEDAALDPSIGVIVLSGKGKHFCSGGDVNWEDQFTPEGGRWLVLNAMKLSNAMRNNGKPIIAAIRGYCIAGGNELNLQSDLTIASETAVFGQAGPKMGSTPVWYGSQMLVRTVGEKKAREVVYLCHRYPAKEALELGWCNVVVPDDQLESKVDEWCGEILDKSPMALRIAKFSLNAESDLLYADVVKSFNWLSTTYGSKEFHEGTEAFLEKRKPRFREFPR